MMADVQLCNFETKGLLHVILQNLITMYLLRHMPAVLKF